jgi:acyl-coenzyme A thioesterase 13
MALNDTKTPEQIHVEKLVANKLPGSPIYAFLLSSAQIISASRGHVIARLPLSQNHMNSSGSLHGAVSAAIVDWMGGNAISTVDFRDKTGVSVDIHVTYQSGAKLGEELEIEGIAEKVGGSMAFTRIGIYKVEHGERGTVVATGTHTKYVKGTLPQKTS